MIFSLLFLLLQGQPLHASDESLKVEFSQRWINVGSKELQVEIAETNEQHERGLMFVKELKDGHGMLFIFERERMLAFWMKNTRIPLSIAYINENLKIVDIQDMQPASVMDENPKPYPSKNMAKYALEVPQGWFARNKIKEGEFISFVSRKSKDLTKVRH